MNPQVIVYCLTYNHENYVRETLEGFVRQKTNFVFNAIIHDDASTDKTQEIIRDYAEKYPNIIIPIFQKENQYSQNIKIYESFIQPLVEAKYTAICEGDDYWCDENKLQRQYDYMELHPECSLCVHNTEMINEAGIGMGKFFNNNSSDVDYTAEEVIINGPGGLFHTSSFFYRTEIRKVRPKDFEMKYVGDYPLAIYLSCKGTVHYVGCIMSKYRVGSQNSWVKASSHNKEYALLHLKDMIESLNRMDTYIDSKYHEQFKKVISKAELEQSILQQGFLKTMLNLKHRREFFDLTMLGKLKLFLKFLELKG